MQTTAPPRSLIVDVVQDGARLHYALPLALHRAGILGRVYTDWFIWPGSREERIAALVARVLPNVGKRFASRRCPDLEGAHVVTSGRLAVRHGLIGLGLGKAEVNYAAESKAFAKWVINQGIGDGHAIVGFCRHAHPDLLLAARSAGRLVILDQIIAPVDVELAEAHMSLEKWPGWQNFGALADGLSITRDLERNSWAAADLITCPSEYVRKGLLAQGVRSEKIAIVPYPIDAAVWPVPLRKGRLGLITIGFVGSVGLRKGAPAFAETARRMRGKARFVMVGAVEPGPARATLEAAGVELVGRVPRSEILSQLERFDVLFFPTTCEGSAGSVMEAMASGLPILTTPNSGSLVRDGIEGFVVPRDDVDAYVDRLGLLAQDSSLRFAMGTAARRRVEAFGLDAYAARLSALIGDLHDRANAA